MEGDTAIFARFGKRLGRVVPKIPYWLILLCVLNGGLSLAWAERLPLTEIVRKTMAIYYADPGHRIKSAMQNPYEALIRQIQPSSGYGKPSGVFVTLSHDGKSRACWGSAYPQHKSVPEAVVYATLGALTKEYRYKPISKTEWKTLKPQVTIIKSIEPIASLRGQNPLSDGLMLRQGARTAVILPGEAKDATYQLVLCKLKAGIRPREKFQLYRMIADVYQ